MINTRAGIKAMKRGLLAVFLVFIVSSASHAGPLGVKIDPFPTIVAGFITSSYNATTGAFLANGLASSLDRGPDLGGKTILTSTPFRLTAVIEKATGQAISGTLTIGAATGTPLLISNTLVGFAYAPVQGGALEFLFGSGVVGSVAGSYIDPLPTNSGIYSNIKPVDVIITGVGFPGHLLNPWAATWSSGGNAAQVREDTPASVPEPSTLLLLLAGAGAGGVSRLRKRNPATAPSVV